VLKPRRFASAALIGVVGAGAILWLRPPWPIGDVTIPTGAGFTVAVTTLRTAPLARTVAARMAAAGIPAFTRNINRSYEVVAGPYVSLDEADAAQRFLAKRGFKARVVVDESVRRPPGEAATPMIGGAADVLLIAGAGSLAVVLELPDEPRHVAAQTISEQQMEVVVSPVTSRVRAMQWKAPAGVSMLRSVSIDQTETGSVRALRARISMPPAVQASVRTSGRRIYIDLSKPAPLPETEELPMPSVLAAGRDRVVQDYRVAIAPVLEKLETMEPFVMSAVAQPAGDVLAALERTLTALGSWADELAPSGEWRQSHNYVVAAVKKAAQAVSSGFTGDREGTAREAFALRDAAKRSMGTVAENAPPDSH
jgi:hypothetical protein